MKHFCIAVQISVDLAAFKAFTSMKFDTSLSRTSINCHGFFPAIGGMCFISKLILQSAGVPILIHFCKGLCFFLPFLLTCLDHLTNMTSNNVYSRMMGKVGVEKLLTNCQICFTDTHVPSNQ